MVEGEDEELVLVIELLEQKPVDGRARVRDAAAEHAVADVEQHAEAHGHALAGELRQVLFFPILEDVEIGAREIGDEMSVGIAHRHRDAGDVDARAERLPVLSEAEGGAGPEGRGNECNRHQAHAPDYHRVTLAIAVVLIGSRR